MKDRGGELSQKEGPCIQDEFGQGTVHAGPGLAGGAWARSFRALQVTVRSLNFILSTKGGTEKVLSKEMTIITFLKVTLPVL